MAHRREPTGTDTPITAAHVGSVTGRYWRDTPTVAWNGVALNLPTLDEGDTSGQLGEFVGTVGQLGW
jgi:hypothetical protein